MSETNEKTYDIIDQSGGIQRRTSRFLQRDSDAWESQHSDFSQIGAVGKALGYIQFSLDLTSTTSTSTSTSTTSTSTSTSSSTSTSTSTTTTA